MNIFTDIKRRSEVFMLAFYQQHPFVKSAGWYDIPPALTSFLKTNSDMLRTKLRAMSKPSYYTNLAKQTAKRYAPEITGGALGIVPGAYMGNQAFNNPLPPVRTLPNLEQLPYIEVERPYGN